MTAFESISNSTTTTMEPLTSGDSAYWPNWVNIGIPIVSIIAFVVAIVLSIKYGQKKPTHIEVPVIVTKNDATHSNNSIDKKSDVSDSSDKKDEAQDKLTMLQKAKEQAMKSRAAKRLSSIRSRVSSSSQYDYSPLDDAAGGAGLQIEQDSSDDETDHCLQENDNVVTVDVIHHSPPRNVLISSEDSGFNDVSARTSMSEIV